MKDLNDRWEDEVYSIAAERREPVHITARVRLNRLIRRVEQMEEAARNRHRAYQRGRASEGADDGREG